MYPMRLTIPEDLMRSLLRAILLLICLVLLPVALFGQKTVAALCAHHHAADVHVEPADDADVAVALTIRF